MPERRRRLRRLDAALAGEIDDAGSTSFLELVNQVNHPDRLLLGRTTSPETLREWWDFAIARGLLEAGPTYRHRLATPGKEVLAQARRAELSPSEPAARKTLSLFGGASVLAVAVGGATIAKASPAAAVAVGSLLVLALLTYVSAVLADAIDARLITPRLSRRLLSADAAWLDGDRVDWLLGRSTPALPVGTDVHRINGTTTTVGRSGG